MDALPPAEDSAPLTPEQFARLVTPLRADLLSSARARYGLSDADAEDLVEDAILAALQRLDAYHPQASALSRSSAQHPVLRWLLRMMDSRRRADRKRNARRPQTAPIEAALNHPAPPDPSLLAVTINQRPLLHYLPRHYEQLVQAWLDGYTQEEIAGGFRLHRNTVAIRLEYAFQVLGRAMPREDEITLSSGLISARWNQPTIYHKPQGVWRSWMRRHPADRILLSARPARNGRRLGVAKTTLKVARRAKSA